MIIFTALLIIEILSLIVLKQHFYSKSAVKYLIALFAHILLSLWIWIIFFETLWYNSFYDSPKHVWLMMTFMGVFTAVILPRIVLIVLHFTGRFINRRNGSHIRWLTTTGLILSVIVLVVIIFSSTYGRFNFKTEEVSINIKGLNPDLDGLKIIQISDLHLTAFYHHKKRLEEVIQKINQQKPDLVLNTGDFVSIGWREYDHFDTILAKTVSKYGNFAILGNHDEGTYDPYFSEAERANNVLIMNNMIKASGYQLLNNEYKKVQIGAAVLAIIGVTTAGRHPNIIHGDINAATAGLGKADLKILLTHDPNHWNEAIKGKTDIQITLSGHTHGMQMGILTKKFRWSPSKYFYPHWNGLYSSGDQYHYVNRGLGVLAIPFRIWMPPEITLITLKKQ